jgi:hypothetical protein
VEAAIAAHADLLPYDLYVTANLKQPPGSQAVVGQPGLGDRILAVSPYHDLARAMLVATQWAKTEPKVAG